MIHKQILQVVKLSFIEVNIIFITIFMQLINDNV
jgi:hypothetical protein